MGRWPTFGGDIGRGSIALVGIEMVVEARIALAQAGNGRSVGEEDVDVGLVQHLFNSGYYLLGLEAGYHFIGMNVICVHIRVLQDERM